MKYRSFILMAAALILSAGCSDIQTNTAESSVSEAASAESETVSAAQQETETETGASEAAEERYPALLTSAEDIALTDVDGQGCEYTFSYNDNTFYASYFPDKWQVRDSFMIRNYSDIELICKALSDEHPIHSADYTDYRTPRDMAREWQQHNLAFDMLPEDSPWKESARSVDLDPQDQGKSTYEMFRDKIGFGGGYN